MRLLGKYGNNKEIYSSDLKQQLEDEVMPLLYKYMEGSASDDESERVEKFLLLQGVRKNINKNSPVEFTHKLWLNLAKRLEFNNEIVQNNSVVRSATEGDFRQYVYQTKSQRDKNKLVKYCKSVHSSILKYAVASVVILGVFYFGLEKLNVQELFYTKALTKFRNYDSIKRITLEDGSIVYLNRSSDIAIYKSLFNKEKREVWINGEAYFEVSKNPNKPFIVHNGQFSVEVKGTAFNIKNYSQINRYVVSVTQGKVQVKKGNTQLGLLTKNKELIYDISNNSYQISKKNCNQSKVWVQGKLMLDNVNIQELKLRLKQYFNVELMAHVDTSYFNHIQFSSPVLRSNTNAFDIMEKFCTIYQLDFKMSNDGTKCYLSQ